jgi:hypothetical protein
LGILACKTVSSRSVAILIASFYAAPAGMAGYYLGLGMGCLVFVAAVFQQISAIVFGVLIFIHSWKRLAPLDFSVAAYGKEETKSRSVSIRDVEFTEVLDSLGPSMRRFHEGKRLRLPSS